MRPPELLAERILDGDVGAIDELSAIERGEPLAALLGAAAARRDRAWGRTVTYSRKVFLPLTNLCRDRCAYCTFRKDPGDPDAWTMSPDEVAAWSERARAQGCKEALVCLGDRPESLYPSYRATLGGHGARSTAEYV